MPRILLLIVLIWIIYVLIKFFIKKAHSVNQEAKDGSQAEKVIACVKCGMHVPESETHTIDGKIFCKNPNCNN